MVSRPPVTRRRGTGARGGVYCDWRSSQSAGLLALVELGGEGLGGTDCPGPALTNRLASRHSPPVKLRRYSTLVLAGRADGDRDGLRAPTPEPDRDSRSSRRPGTSRRRGGRALRAIDPSLLDGVRLEEPVELSLLAPRPGCSCRSGPSRWPCRRRRGRPSRAAADEPSGRHVAASGQQRSGAVERARAVQREPECRRRATASRVADLGLDPDDVGQGDLLAGRMMGMPAATGRRPA